MNKTAVTQPVKITNSLLPVQGLLQRKCPCGNHTPAGRECAECAKKKTGLQRKLAIGASNDPLEHEADRVAEQVMSAPLNSVVNAAPPRIQRFSGQGGEGLSTAPASVDRVLSGSGRPLEPVLQHDMGQRFGHDFSQVRVHTGGAAEQSARDVNARAYTVGNNVVFGAGQFAPGSQEGQRLLAHELTHVIQQNSVIHRQIIQRTLLARNRDCSAMTALPIAETATVNRGVHHTETFSKPPSRKIKVTVQATNNAEPNCTFGVDVWQCHIAGDEPIEEQHIAGVGAIISYKISLPDEKWNTYDKFALRIRVNCQADLDVKVDPA